jgi:hypothetical protein
VRLDQSTYKKHCTWLSTALQKFVSATGQVHFEVSIIKKNLQSKIPALYAKNGNPNGVSGSPEIQSDTDQGYQTGQAGHFLLNKFYAAARTIKVEIFVFFFF